MNFISNDILPSTILDFLKKRYFRFRFMITLVINYYYDFKRFFKFSATLDPYQTKIRYQGRIIAHYHVIEKGLSLKNPRIGFGTTIVNNLVLLLQNYQEKYGLDEITQVGLNVLFSYYKFNLEHGQDNQELYQQLTDIKNNGRNLEECTIQEGGIINVSKQEIQKLANINFKDFVKVRYSVRHFDSSDVAIDVIKNAVSIALKTPSVCNRQTWKVYVFSQDEEKIKVLSHQNGNRGFGNTASKILIITSNLSYFIGTSERNQCFIDGGLFAMSLIYALHSLGVGTCCLNWSVEYQTDQALKKDAGIEDCESIIMMLAVGNLPEYFSVANSSRRKVDEVLIVK